MEMSRGYRRFWTTFTENREEGFGGYQLYCEANGKITLVGQTIYWDAMGEFTFGTFDGGDVPVEVVEAAIAEAREGIKLR